MPLIVLAVSAVLLALLLAHTGEQQRLRAWGRLAERNALHLYTGKTLAIPYVSGAYRGRELVMDTATRRIDKREVHGTRITLRTRNPMRLSLGIRDHTYRDTLAELTGAQDVQTGDAAVDARFEIRANSEVIARRVLADEALRRKLLAAGGEGLQIVLGERELSLVKAYVEADLERLQSWFDLLSDLADIVERQAPVVLGPPPK